MYHDCVENTSTTFLYRIIPDLNTHKTSKTSHPENYVPNVGFTIFDPLNEEISYAEVEREGNRSFTPKSTGLCKVCLKSLNDR